MGGMMSSFAAGEEDIVMGCDVTVREIDPALVVVVFTAGILGGMVRMGGMDSSIRLEKDQWCLERPIGQSNRGSGRGYLAHCDLDRRKAV